MNKAKIGLIGIVGGEEFWSAMERIAAIGYQGIEGGSELLKGDAAENLKRFHGLGLQVLTVSASRERLRDDLTGLIAEAKALQSPRATVWWGTCDSREEILIDAKLYNITGKILADEGIKLCYHHHDHEFKTSFHGVAALDILAEHTDPAWLAFEVDIAWITLGGHNPVSVIQRMASRIPAIHVKDVYGLDTRDKWTAVGTGIVDVKGSIQSAIDAGIEWIVVEQDKLRNLNAMETVTVSYLNLKEAGLI